MDGLSRKIGRKGGWTAPRAATLAVLLLATTACNQARPAGGNQVDQATNAVQPVEQAAVDQTADAETIETAAAEPAAPEPDSDFLEGCIVGRQLTGSLWQIGTVRAGDVVAGILGDNQDYRWEPDGNGSFILRFNKLDTLTQTSTTAAIRMRRLDVAPVEAPICGPQAIVIDRVAYEGQALSPADTFQIARQVAMKAARLRADGSLGTINYHEETPVDSTGPFSEEIAGITDTKIHEIVTTPGRK